MFSIVIPSWNNLSCLRLCIESLHRHSAREHQIIVHVNGGDDGTREWVGAEGIEHTASEGNVGICYGVNRASGLAKARYLIYMNDDMVAAPGWDLALERAIERVRPHGLFMLSGTMIEPVDSGNACAVVADFGRDAQSFDLERFGLSAPGLSRADWLGATWPPTLVARDSWTLVGGYSTEFSPGFGSDNDFSMKLWHAGCRVFLGVGDSLFYHFARVSTARIRANDGRGQFLRKWGMTQSTFDRFYLRRGRPAGGGVVSGDPQPSAALRWQRLKGAIRRRFT